MEPSENNFQIMDFDPTNSLKRCNSTPTINQFQPNSQSVKNLTFSPSAASNSMPVSQNMTTTSRSRDASPTPTLNIFAPRARRYSTGFSPLATNPGPLPRLTPRVSQLRQEECADMSTREVSHERGVHAALQISQSWEDLTLDTESWSVRSDAELSNPLQVSLPTNIISCSSPSPTSSRAGMRLPYGLSPSPTRRTFQTRRSMSPIAMRPSSLGPVKRKFELDDSNSCSPQPVKRIFTDRDFRSHTCPSPDSTEGRTTPKFYVSKLYTTNTNSSSSLSSSPSAAPSPSSASAMEMQIDIPSVLSSANNTESNVSSSGIVANVQCQSEQSSDLEGSDFDSDSQMKMPNVRASLSERFDKKTDDAASNPLKKLFFERVRTDSTETEASIEFKQPPKDVQIDILYSEQSSLNEENGTPAADKTTLLNNPNIAMIPALVVSMNEVGIDNGLQNDKEIVPSEPVSVATESEIVMAECPATENL